MFSENILSFLNVLKLFLKLLNEFYLKLQIFLVPWNLIFLVNERTMALRRTLAASTCTSEVVGGPSPAFDLELCGHCWAERTCCDGPWGWDTFRSRRVITIGVFWKIYTCTCVPISDKLWVRGSCETRFGFILVSDFVSRQNKFILDQ